MCGNRRQKHLLQRASGFIPEANNRLTSPRDRRGTTTHDGENQDKYRYPSVLLIRDEPGCSFLSNPMNDQAFALHITCTCYGTWLPGDARGHVSRAFDPDRNFGPKQNVPGTLHAPANPKTFAYAKSLQKQPTVRLTDDLAIAACSSLVEAAAKRKWRILRAAVMANHVHCLIFDCPNDGSTVRRILKGISQSDLCKCSGELRRWWTAGGSDRYKNGDNAIEAAIQYIANQEYILAEIVDMQVVQHS
jgi:REP element-mobilizing transposase RayT